MSIQPGHRPQPTATPAGQPTLDDAATKFLADLESAYADTHTLNPIPTSYRDPTPLPAYGSTPPVIPEYARPPMSQRAVDLNTTILSTSVLTAAMGGAVSAILWASGAADPTVIRWICACIVAVPVAIAVPVLALKGLMKSAKEVAEAAPPVINQHYSGPVTQTNTTVNAHVRGVIAVQRNELPPARNHTGDPYP